ncbi:MAG: phosphoribosylglycinamide formyltransferase [Betaproteobacteria bacterium]
MKSVVILISGRGSNMEAIVKANLPIEVRAVIANRPDAKGLQYAAAHGIQTSIVDHKSFSTREAFDERLADTIDRYAPDCILLAGFMRVLTDAFVARYRRRIINIHPSLLPAFPGLHTHRQAIAAGAKLHGATVHFVTGQLDHGPIIVQAAVPVLNGDSEASLAARVLEQEHRIYPMAIRWLAEDRLEFVAEGVVQVKGLRVSSQVSTPNLCSPSE